MDGLIGRILTEIEERKDEMKMTGQISFRLVLAIRVQNCLKGHSGDITMYGTQGRPSDAMPCGSNIGSQYFYCHL